LLAPGFEPKEIEISAMPEGIVVQGEHQVKQAEPAELRMSEFGSKKMYRRLDLPAPVDPDGCVANDRISTLCFISKAQLAGFRAADKTPKSGSSLICNTSRFLTTYHLIAATLLFDVAS
jgi:hypothetical protein